MSLVNINRNERSGLDLAKSDPTMPKIHIVAITAMARSIIPRLSEPNHLACFFSETPSDSTARESARKLPPPPTYLNGCIEPVGTPFQTPVLSTAQQLGSRTLEEDPRFELGRPAERSLLSPRDLLPPSNLNARFANKKDRGPQFARYSLPALKEIFPITHFDDRCVPIQADAPRVGEWPEPPITRYPLHGNHDRSKLASVQYSAFRGQSLDLFHTISKERNRGNKYQTYHSSVTELDAVRAKLSSTVNSSVAESGAVLENFEYSARIVAVANRALDLLDASRAPTISPSDKIARTVILPAKELEQSFTAYPSLVNSSPDSVHSRPQSSLDRPFNDRKGSKKRSFTDLENPTTSTKPEKKRKFTAEVGIQTNVKPKNQNEVEYEDYDSDDSDCEMDNSCEANHPHIGKLQPGEIYDLIHGRKRKRAMLEDSLDLQNQWYSKRWDELCTKPLDTRGHVCGYEEGDRHYTFLEWQEQKAKRVCRPGQIRDPISGRIRERALIDAYPHGIQNCRLSAKWDRLAQELNHGPEARERIWGYREGDLDLSWEELKKARALRAGWWIRE